MDFFPSTRNSGSRPSEWNRKPPRGCHRKLNFYASTESQKLPSVGVPNGQANALRWASKSSYQVDSNQIIDNCFTGEYRDKKKTVARRHLIGSLSAPMKTTAAVKTTSIGRSGGSPPRGYPEVNRTHEAGNFCQKPEGDYLQGIDKIDNIFQRRLDLRIQKPPSYKNLSNHMPPTSLQNRISDNANVRRPLFMASDVGKLSDLNDIFSDDVSDDNHHRNLYDTVDYSQQKRIHGYMSQHRPLTPNLMKKLNNMKLSTLTKTQLWVNQLPQEPPVFNTHLSKHGSCPETSFGNNLNNESGKVHTKWIYGGER